MKSIVNKNSIYNCQRGTKGRFYMTKQRGINLGDNITLRPCLASDSDFYYNVKKITLKEYVEKTYGDWNEKYQLERHKKNFNPVHSQIIQFQGIDIGILAIEDDSETVMVHNIEILPEFQNKGIGSVLLKKVIQNTIADNKSISLQVYKSNPKAQKFYRRLGFLIEASEETETHIRMRFML